MLQIASLYHLLLVHSQVQFHQWDPNLHNFLFYKLDLFHINLERKFVDVLKEKVLINKTPILGICLGMQVMAKMGFEMKKTEGLGWFDAEVIKINSSNTNFKIPNIGWENIEFKPNGFLFNNSQVNLDFYFVHSYFMKCNNDDDMTSWYYLDNQKITASIQKENIFGTQFHPEKSSDYGRGVLIKFIEY